MANEIVDHAGYYPYLLVGAWPSAWQKFRGRVSDVGALPGLLLAAEADILRNGDQSIRAGAYWLSKVRADLNLSFWRAQAEGWIAKVTLMLEPQIDNTRLLQYQRDKMAEKFYGTLDGVAWLFDGYSVQSVRGTLAQYPDGADLKWWIVTLKGVQALNNRLQAFEAAKQEHEKQLRELGFLASW